MTVLGLNARLGKKVNRELILKTIYNHRPIYRADIAKITGLTPASITKIINEFLDIGIVREISKGKTFSGRKSLIPLGSLGVIRVISANPFGNNYIAEGSFVNDLRKTKIWSRLFDFTKINQNIHSNSEGNARTIGMLYVILYFI